MKHQQLLMKRFVMKTRIYILSVLHQDVAVVNDEKTMDEEVLVKDNLGLPDAAVEIEIHQNANELETVFFFIFNSSYKKCKMNNFL